MPSQIFIRVSLLSIHQRRGNRLVAEKEQEFENFGLSIKIKNRVGSRIGNFQKEQSNKPFD